MGSNSEGNNATDLTFLSEARRSGTIPQTGRKSRVEPDKVRRRGDDLLADVHGCSPRYVSQAAGEFPGGKGRSPTPLTHAPSPNPIRCEPQASSLCAQARCLCSRRGLGGGWGEGREVLLPGRRHRTRRAVSVRPLSVPAQCLPLQCRRSKRPGPKGGDHDHLYYHRERRRRQCRGRSHPQARPERGDQFAREEYPFYYVPGLPAFIAGEKDEQGLIIHDRDWYAQHRLDLHLATGIASILPEEMAVVTATGARYRYDKACSSPPGGRRWCRPLRGPICRGW